MRSNTPVLLVTAIQVFTEEASFPLPLLHFPSLISLPFPSHLLLLKVGPLIQLVVWDRDERYFLHFGLKKSSDESSLRCTFTMLGK